MPRAPARPSAWEPTSAPSETDGAYKRIAQALHGGTRIAIEEKARFAVFDNLRREMPAAEFVSGDPVTVACRVIKSPAEIAPLQRANDITIAAYKSALATLHEGMDQRGAERQHRRRVSRPGLPTVMP